MAGSNDISPFQNRLDSSRKAFGRIPADMALACIKSPACGRSEAVLAASWLVIANRTYRSFAIDATNVCPINGIALDLYRII